jgi:hypothetical protein
MSERKTMLTLSDVIEEYDICRESIKKLADTNAIPHIRKGNGTYSFHREHLDRYFIDRAERETLARKGERPGRPKKQGRPARTISTVLFESGKAAIR